MQLYKINHQIIKLIEKTIEQWNISLMLQHLERNIEIPGLKLRRGIFQGDSFFSLPFCLLLDPLSNLINEQGLRYILASNKRMSKETGKMTHLPYMDDLKLFAPNDKKLAEQLKLVKRYSDDIQMGFVRDKCAKCTFVQGRPT